MLPILPRSMPFNARMHLRLRLRAARLATSNGSPISSILQPKDSGSNGIGKARGVGVGRGGGKDARREVAGVPLCVGMAPLPKEKRGGHSVPADWTVPVTGRYRCNVPSSQARH